MKPFLPLFLFTLLPILPLSAIEFFVAPTGNDQNAGTKEKPLQTLEGARDALRAWRKANPNRTDEAATLWLAGGRYELKHTFALNESDSGKMGAPVSYRAQPGEKVRITGGRAVPPALIKPVSDPATLQRVAESVRPHLAQIDLREMGLTDFGTIGPRGYRHPYLEAPVEVIFNEAPLDLSIFPKRSEPAIFSGQPKDVGPGLAKRDDPARPTALSYKLVGRNHRVIMGSDQPNRWGPPDDVWLTGIFPRSADGKFPRGIDATFRLQRIDVKENLLFTDQPLVDLGRFKVMGTRWRALNVLEELTNPGEYVMDHATGQVIFYPPGDLATAAMEVTVLKDPLIAMEGASFVQFEDVVLENGRGIGVYLERGEANKLIGCSIRNFGIVAVSIGRGVTADPTGAYESTGEPASRMLGSLATHLYKNPAFDREGGRNHSIENCEIAHTGAGGVSLGGGDRRTLVAANNSVINCRIRDFNRWDLSYKGAVNVSGVGNRVAHNQIHDGAGPAICLLGNDHVVEFNEIFDCLQLADEAGVIYVSRNPTERGNAIRHNDFHDNGNPEANNQEMGVIYLDNGNSGTEISGNIFRFNAMRPFYFCQELSDYSALNNLFVDLPQPFFLGRAEKPPRLSEYRNRVSEDISLETPPYSIRYPTLTTMIPADRIPNGRFEGNFFINARGLPDPAKNQFLAAGNILPNTESADAINRSILRAFLRRTGLAEKKSLETPDFDLTQPPRLREKLLPFPPIPIEQIGPSIRPDEKPPETLPRFPSS